MFDRMSSRRESTDRRSRSRDRDRGSAPASSSHHRSRTGDDYRSSAATTAAAASETRESSRSRYDNVSASSSSVPSSYDRRRSSDKQERDRGDRASGPVDAEPRERPRDRERDRERDRDRERIGNGDYVSRSSRRWQCHDNREQVLPLYVCIDVSFYHQQLFDCFYFSFCVLHNVGFCQVADCRYVVSWTALFHREYITGWLCCILWLLSGTNEVSVLAKASAKAGWKAWPTVQAYASLTLSCLFYYISKNAAFIATFGA